MKKIIILIVLTGMVQVGSSQFFKDLGKQVVKSAKKSTTRKTKRETEKKTEKTLDKVFNPKIGEKRKERKRKEATEEEEMYDALENEQNTDTYEKKKKVGIKSELETKKEEENPLAGLFGGGEKAKHEKQYLFAVTANMMMVSYNKKKTDTMFMEQGYGKKAMQTTIKGRLIITDWGNESSIIIDDEKKTAQVMSLSWMSKIMKRGKKEELNKEEEEKNVTFKKTGKTKLLNGYLCHQYIITTEDSKIDVWFAPDVNFSYKDYLSGFSKMFGSEIKKAPMDKGYMMEMTMFEKEKKKSYILVKSINLKPVTIDLNAYKVQSLF